MKGIVLGGLGGCPIGTGWAFQKGRVPTTCLVEYFIERIRIEERESRQERRKARVSRSKVERASEKASYQIE